METYTVEVQNVTFVVEAEDKYDAVLKAEEILWDVALDYSTPYVV
jgi:hypothetical protein